MDDNANQAIMIAFAVIVFVIAMSCLLYTSDAADDNVSG